ncbi:MAG: DUF2249 domain-containing protein [Burkholderiales bacterium]
MITIDARGLDPPEPFERVIDALAKLEPGEEVLLILDREPAPLYRFLAKNGYRFEPKRCDDRRYEIRIWEEARSIRPGIADD